MYAAFFRLAREPFSIAPDPRFLYMSDAHREALAHLLYGVSSGSAAGGFVLLTGEIGAGKTTVCRCFLEQVPAHCDVAYVFNPRMEVPELLRTVCDEFHVTVTPGPGAGGTATIKDHVDALNAFLLAGHAAGRRRVLVIDEAQSLAPEVLEQLRLLTNLETDRAKLLQIVLIGQPELREMLARPELEQLAQRVIARWHLPALGPAETEAYVRHRLAVAGLDGPLPFEPRALARLHALGRGVPRRINLLADRALLGAWAGGQAVVTRSIVERAAEEVFGPRVPSPDGARQRIAMLGVLAGVGLAVAVFGAWRAWVSPDAAGGVEAVAAVSTVAGDAAPVAPGALAGATAARPGDPRSSGTNAVAAGPLASAAARGSVEGLAAGVGAGAGAGAGAGTAAAPGAPADIRPAPGAGVLEAGDAAGAWSAAWPVEAEAWRRLGARWALSLPDTDPCAAAARQRTPCFRGSASLPALRELGRPVLLTLRDGTGRPAWALATAIDRDGVVLEAPDGSARRVPLALLAGLWRGEYATLWRTPPGWPAGAALPGAPEPESWPAPLRDWLARSVPGPGQAPLQARIVAFQVANGLRPDGLPGPLTLMTINRASGVAEPRLDPPR